MARADVELRWFVDENDLGLGKAMAAVRRDVAYPGHPRLPEVPRGALDPDWLPVVGELGLIVISRDKELRRNAAERRLLASHVVRVVSMTGNKNLSNWDRLRLVARFWDEIEQHTDEPGPWILSLSMGGLRMLDAG